MAEQAIAEGDARASKVTRASVIALRRSTYPYVILRLALMICDLPGGEESDMLIFSHLCRVVAVLGLFFSAFMFLAAYNTHRIIDQAVAARQYDLDFKLGVQCLLASIVLGTLAEISFSLRNRS